MQKVVMANIKIKTSFQYTHSFDLLLLIIYLKVLYYLLHDFSGMDISGS